MDTIQLSGVASVLVMGVSLLLAVRVLALSGERTAAEDVLRQTAYILLAVGAMGACFFVAGPWGFVAWPIAMTLWARAAINIRAVQKRNLLGALAFAIQKHMPLAPVALAFADEQDGSFAGRARALADRLERGVPLEQAVRQSRQALPPESAMAAALGQETGDLAAALEATTYASRFDRSWLQPAISRLCYMLAVLMAFNAVVTYLRVSVLPAYIKIFDDYDHRLPDSTIAMISHVPTPSGQWQVSNPLLALPESVLDWLTFNCPAPLLMALISFGWLSVLTVLSMLLTLALMLCVWLQWRGTLMPRLPGLRKVINWMDMGPVLRGVALAARDNRPLVGVLVAMARLHPKRTVRRRLRRVVRDLDNGIPWYDGLRRQRLIDRNDAALLAAAGASGNLAWALTETAAGFERRATYRLQAIAQTFLPLLVLPVGLLTALIAAAYFVPLVDLVIYLS